MIERDNDGFSERDEAKSAASMSDFNADDYRPYLDGLELDQDQADALLFIIWNMMRMYIEMNVPAESWGQIIGTVIDPKSGESS